MKTKNIQNILNRIRPLTLSILAVLPPALFAQSTRFAYSGSLSESNTLVNGPYEFRFELYGQVSGGGALAGPLTNSPVTVSNGLFTVQLDFGAAPFDGGDRWLEIGVRKIAAVPFSTLSPRQMITPIPYAITARNLSAPLAASALGGVYSNAVTLNHPANVFVGNGSGLSGITSTTLGGKTATEFWQRGGNSGTTPGTHFLGTTDGQALELKVGNARALRLEPNSSAPNVIGGAAINTVDVGIAGATISGGGTIGQYTNRVGAHHSTVSGGAGNYIEGFGSLYSTIGGGWLNSVSGLQAVISGGAGNTIQVSRSATIGGGEGNMIQYNASTSRGTIGGGYQNVIGTNAASGTIGGGSQNILAERAAASTIAGGQNNEVQKEASAVTIGGGSGNLVSSNADYATISGGSGNKILTNTSYASIAGGRNGSIGSESSMATIGGGSANVIRRNSPGAAIGGGMNHSIGTNSPGATVSGGLQNEIQDLTQYATVSGGLQNRVESGAYNSFIGAGGYNVVGFDAYFGTIAGGGGNALAPGAVYATVGGGEANRIGTNSVYSTIAGGLQNSIAPSTVLGTIGGGGENKVLSSYGVVPGGDRNEAGSFGFAAGRRAKATHAGAFVWADATDADFASTTTNQFRVRANGGVNFETGGAGVTVDGTPIGSGGGGGGSNNGAGITNLNAAALAFGTVPDARLSANVPRLNSAATFNGALTTTDDLIGLRLKVGTGHLLSGFKGTIAGGENNTNLAGWAFIGGGRSNLVNSPYGVIGGGEANSVDSLNVTIGGGRRNSVATDAVEATIGGGAFNRVGINATYATIGGGNSNVVYGYGATIAGGRDNRIDAQTPDSTIAGGAENVVRSNAFLSMIGGGGRNDIGDGSYFSTIAGGIRNTISLDSRTSVIGGGGDNLIQGSSLRSVIAGGIENTIETSASAATISGGSSNLIRASSPGSVVSGGEQNVIGTGSPWATIGGGSGNTNGVDHGTIAGGLRNLVYAGSHGSVIGGGASNRVGGAVFISPFPARDSTISGGSFNAIMGGPNLPIEGATVGGGVHNRVEGNYATIPGGFENYAIGSYSFAAGRRARAEHNGAFVWADATDADFASTSTSQFLIRAAGGVGIGATNLTGALFIRQPTGAPAAGMSAADNGLGLGQFSTSSYKWIQSYGGALALNPVGNNVGIGTTNPAARLQVVNATCDGNNWVNSSDRNLKENFRPVDAQQVLEKVAGLAIQQWNYKSTPGQSHVGPVAQDFRAAFGLGADDTSIGTVDADGVALAAIQGLNQKLTDELKRRDAENAELKLRLQRLERLIHSTSRDAK
jgi:hypothetical protein